METTPVILRNTKLTDRTVWFDGLSSFDPSRVAELLPTYDISYVDEITQDIRSYNRLVPADKQLKAKTHNSCITFDWNIPEPYNSLDVINYVVSAHTILTEGMPDDEVTKRTTRLAKELVEYKKRSLFDVLRASIWMINMLEQNGIVYGVGRGSSTSSYVLYIIGVHDVDSYLYDLDIDDFLHD